MNTDIMESLGFSNEVEYFKQGICPLCKDTIGEFRDELSEREASISGMCQSCQDNIFED